MKPDDYLETNCGVSPQRVVVDFENACSAAIPIRNAAGSKVAHHASLFIPNLLVRQIVIPARLSSPTRGRPSTNEPITIPNGVSLGMTPGDFAP
jgi:hypothetical protein